MQKILGTEHFGVCKFFLGRHPPHAIHGFSFGQRLTDDHVVFAGPAEEIFFSIFEFVFALCGITFMTFVVAKYAAAKYFR